jgi:hypothetical protein
MSGRPKVTDKYPSLVILGYIYSGKGEPQTLALVNDAEKRSIAYCHHLLDPSGSSIGIEDWGYILGVQTTISIRLCQAAPKLSEFLAWVWLTGHSIIDN